MDVSSYTNEDLSLVRLLLQSLLFLNDTCSKIATYFQFSIEYNKNITLIFAVTGF